MKLSFMRKEAEKYDVALIGGGLAGLSLAIQLAMNHRKVVVIEKWKEAQQKVCGEYVSNESWQFLHQLGIPLSDMQLPKIHQLVISSESRLELSAPLEQGGFGISRILLESELRQSAMKHGVHLHFAKALDVKQQNELSEIVTTNGSVYARLVGGSYGKITPHFLTEKTNNQEFVAVKYHLPETVESHKIELFKYAQGYGGFSQVENNTLCICYLVKASALRRYEKDKIKSFEQDVLMKNKRVAHFFEEIHEKNIPSVTISRMYFKPKGTANETLLLLGDAAGAITPLSGNGMSVAMRTTALLTPYILDFLENKITRTELNSLYANTWNKHFKFHLWKGNAIQKLFFMNGLSSVFLTLVNRIPFLSRAIIKSTYGKPFIAFLKNDATRDKSNHDFLSLSSTEI